MGLFNTPLVAPVGCVVDLCVFCVKGDAFTLFGKYYGLLQNLASTDLLYFCNIKYKNVIMTDIRRWDSRGQVWLTPESRVASHCSSHAHLTHFSPKLSFRSNLLRCGHWHSRERWRKYHEGCVNENDVPLTRKGEERLKCRNEDIHRRSGRPSERQSQVPLFH